jgi:hypothetical protein
MDCHHRWIISRRQGSQRLQATQNRSLAGRAAGDDNHPGGVDASYAELGQSGFDGALVALAHNQGNPCNVRPGEQRRQGVRKKGTARQSHEGLA